MPTKTHDDAEYMTDDVVDMDEESLYENDNEDTKSERSSAIQSGWAAVHAANQQSDKKYTEEFRPSEKKQLIKFLRNEPFAVFNQHWIERSGKKSFVCLPDGCPLCDIAGDTPRQKAAFSVVNLSVENYEVEMFLTSPTLTRQLASFDSDPKTGPVDRMFWEISRQGSGPKTTYTIVPVKPRDLADDYGLDIVKVEEALESMSPLTDKIISFTPREQMKDIAREVGRN